MAGKYYAEAVVIGAGPAGMGTALALARKGIRVVILEKEERIGACRRGETIRFDEKMDSILGKGFFDKQTIKKINKRTYFSHTGLKKVSRKIKNPNHIINWTDFMQAMGDVLKNEGVDILLGTAATGFINNRGRITGVKFSSEDNKNAEFTAKAVFSCGGFEDPASRFLKTDRSKMDFPVSKQLLKGYMGPDDRLEYYFHLDDGNLSIATIFPRGNLEAEIILMSTSADGSKLLNIEIFCNEHPKFAERISGAVPFYSLDTFIPMGGMLRNCSPLPGVIMLGDAMGHVQARGGSGIKASFLIGYEAGELSASDIISGQWNQKTSRAFNKKLIKSPALSSLRRHNVLYLSLRPLIFGKVRTPQEMDKIWPLLKHALR